MAKKPTKKKSTTPKRVQLKTKKIIVEGKSPQQAAAIAWSLYRAKRLSPRGGLLPKPKSKKRQR